MLFRRFFRLNSKLFVDSLRQEIRLFRQQSSNSASDNDFYRRKLKIFKSKPLLSVNSARQLLESSIRNRIVVLDTVFQADNNTAAFEEEHLPGAQHFYINEVVHKTDTKVRNLVHPLVFQDYARQLGIKNDSLVLLYDHGEVDKAILSATYTHWLFQVYGIEQVGIMNGGLNIWKQHGFPVESGPSKSPKNANGETNPEDLFFATWNPREVVSLPDIAELRDSHRFLDARIKAHYEGTDKPGTAKIAGRLQGAINIPTSEFIDDSGCIIEGDEINNLIDKHLGGHRSVIAYCNTAFQSSGLHFVLKNAGLKSRNYDGSWVEFSHLGDDELKH